MCGFSPFSYILQQPYTRKIGIGTLITIRLQLYHKRQKLSIIVFHKLCYLFWLFWIFSRFFVPFRVQKHPYKAGVPGNILKRSGNRPTSGGGVVNCQISAVNYSKILPQTAQAAGSSPTVWGTGLSMAICSSLTNRSSPLESVP